MGFISINTAIAVPGCDFCRRALYADRPYARRADDSVHHDGDLGNLVADSTGTAHYEYTDPTLALTGPNAIIGLAVSFMRARMITRRSRPVTPAREWRAG